MNTNVWSKYLPVIRIFMKRALSTEQQVLTLNVPDFEKAMVKRKTALKFSLDFKNGRVKNVIVDNPLASGLASVLLDDEVTKALLEKEEFKISMGPKYELTIRHIPRTELQELHQ